MKVLKLKEGNGYFVKVVREKNSPFGRIVNKRNVKNASKLDDVLINGIKDSLYNEFAVEYEIVDLIGV